MLLYQHILSNIVEFEYHNSFKSYQISSIIEFKIILLNENGDSYSI